MRIQASLSEHVPDQTSWVKRHGYVMRENRDGTVSVLKNRRQVGVLVRNEDHTWEFVPAGTHKDADIAMSSDEDLLKQAKQMNTSLTGDALQKLTDTYMGIQTIGQAPRTKKFRVIDAVVAKGKGLNDMLSANLFKGMPNRDAVVIAGSHDAPSNVWYSKNPKRACDFILGKSRPVQKHSVGYVLVAVGNVFSINVLDSMRRHGKMGEAARQWKQDVLPQNPEYVGLIRVEITDV